MKAAENPQPDRMADKFLTPLRYQNYTIVSKMVAVWLFYRYTWNMSDPVKLHVSKVLRSKRLAAGLSLGEVSEQTGIRVERLSAYENDSTGMTTEELQQITSALGVEFSDVFKDYKLSQGAKTGG